MVRAGQPILPFSEELIYGRQYEKGVEEAWVVWDLRIPDHRSVPRGHYSYRGSMYESVRGRTSGSGPV